MREDKDLINDFSTVRALMLSLYHLDFFEAYINTGSECKMAQ